MPLALSPLVTEVSNKKKTDTGWSLCHSPTSENRARLRLAEQRRGPLIHSPVPPTLPYFPSVASTLV